MAPLSPSLAPSVPLLIAIVVLLFFHSRQQMGKVGLLVLPLLGLAAAGTKGSTMPLIVAGLALAFVAMILFDRSRLRSLLVDGVLCVGMLVVAYVAVFRGSSSGLHVQFHDAALRPPRSAGSVPSPRRRWCCPPCSRCSGSWRRGTGLLWRLRTVEGRRDPITWVLLGGGLAAAGAVAVFTHPGPEPVVLRPDRPARARTRLGHRPGRDGR